jgi:hypothetical protein
MELIHQHKRLAIEALRDMRGDDLERIKEDFARFTPEEMAKPLPGLIKQSMQDILDWHIERTAKIDAAIEWLEGL